MNRLQSALTTLGFQPKRSTGPPHLPLLSSKDTCFLLPNVPPRQVRRSCSICCEEFSAGVRLTLRFGRPVGSSFLCARPPTPCAQKLQLLHLLNPISISAHRTRSRNWSHVLDLPLRFSLLVIGRQLPPWRPPSSLLRRPFGRAPSPPLPLVPPRPRPLHQFLSLSPSLLDSPRLVSTISSRTVWERIEPRRPSSLVKGSSSTRSRSARVRPAQTARAPTSAPSSPRRPPPGPASRRRLRTLRLTPTGPLRRRRSATSRPPRLTEEASSPRSGCWDRHPASRCPGRSGRPEVAF